MSATGFVWQSSARTSAQTIIVKATFVLEPGHAKLAPPEAWEPIRTTDQFLKDNQHGVLFAPTDRIPYKRRVDVLLVGHAYAPDKQPVRSLIARIDVAEMSKSLEVYCDRGFRASDNRLLEGPRFTKMALDWSRAAGGPGTTNPAGMRFDASPDAVGLVSVPNMQPPKTIVASRADTFSPIGFGPIAPTWPGRTQKLQPFVERFSPTHWTEHPLPEDFDYEFFQSAPPDQQLRHLRSDEPLVLQNLHPTHAPLVTRLPGVSPRAVVNRASGEREDVTFVADTLWIDTDRSICCVVWRGSIGLRHPDEQGLVTVTLVEPVVESSEASLIETIPPGVVDEDELLSMTKLAPFEVKPKGTTMPFVDAAVVARPPGPVRTGDDGALPFGPSGLSGTPPAPIALGQVTLPAQSPTSSPTVQTPLGDRVPTVDALGLSEPMKTAPKTAPSVGATETPSGIQTIRDARQDVTTSSAFGDPSSTFVSRNDRPEQAVQTVQLLWHDASGPLRARCLEACRGLVADAADDAAMAHALLTSSARTDATNVRTVFARATDARGQFVSPVVVLEGELEVLFDELAALRVTISSATAVGTTEDRELNRALDKAREFIGLPELLAAPRVCHELTSRIGAAFVKEKHALPADFLDARMEEALLLGRHYQKRSVLGGTYLRCLFWTWGEAEPFAAYLPTAAVSNLPLLKRFRVLVAVEVHPTQRSDETPGKTLRVLVLGRIASDLTPA